MATTVAKPRKWGWLALDLLGGFAAMLGALALFAPEAAGAFGLPLTLGWPLIAGGIVAMSVAMTMFLRQLRALREG